MIPDIEQPLPIITQLKRKPWLKVTQVPRTEEEMKSIRKLAKPLDYGSMSPQ